MLQVIMSHMYLSLLQKLSDKSYLSLQFLLQLSCYLLKDIRIVCLQTVYILFVKYKLHNLKILFEHCILL